MADPHWYTINNVDQLDTPALVTYPARVKQNIAMAIYMVDDVFRLRPHIKTFKNKEVVLLMMDAGITKFKCATIAEAEMLAMCNVPDVLFAYQPNGPKLIRFIQLNLNYPQTRFSCLVDNESSANIISEAAKANNLIIDVYIDLNVGMDRTGIKPVNALSLYRYANDLPGINLLGLHAYDGHIHDLDMTERTEKCNAAFGEVKKLKENLVGLGYPEPIIIAGGSPTFPIHAQRSGIECSPGTFVYWDRGYHLSCPEQNFLISALVVARVASLISDTLLCIDCGHKSVAAENALDKRIYFLNAPELKMVSQSEEHLVVDAGDGHNYQVGDVLYGSPYHICPSVALYERAITIENNIITGEWMNIARDRKINI
jgi:D-serine deaminase-like pyridoxal phosphate-dependent protein